jgi:hypothetical protein
MLKNQQYVDISTLPSLCQVAFDAQLQTPHPSEPVIVLELGTKRLVVKDLGNATRGLNMLFNAGFTTLLNMFWL